MPTQLQALPSVLRILLMASPLGVLAYIFRWRSGCHIHPQFHLGTVRTLRFSLNFPGDLSHQFHHWNGLNLEVLSKEKKLKIQLWGSRHFGGERS